VEIIDLQNTGTKETGPVATGSDRLGEILKAELELGRLLFTAGSPGQRILDSITFLNEKLAGGKLKVFLGFEALVITLEQGTKRRVGMVDFLELGNGAGIMNPVQMSYFDSFPSHDIRKTTGRSVM
jgi:hypothetical protein